jgi:hypothetical protein
LNLQGREELIDSDRAHRHQYCADMATALPLPCQRRPDLRRARMTEIDQYLANPHSAFLI